MMRVHEAIVAVLRDVGVDVIFGGAGEESMGMQIAVAQAEGVRGIIPKHEQNASFMACGYALFKRTARCAARQEPA
jgi:acetolactate synthase-1/2/3 large subunit